ncbi:MAG: hypothetical protein ACE5GC_02375 [Acidimicrobiia bacterium]
MLSVAVIFFTFSVGAFVIGVFLLGIGAEPGEDGRSPLYIIGWIELVVGLVLITQVFILVQQSGGEPLILTLAGLVVLFALFFIALGLALVKGTDLRPIGAIAFSIGVISPFYAWSDLFNGTFVFQSSAIWWGLAFFGVAAFTYGKLEANIMGAALVITAIWGFVPVAYLVLDKTIP